VTAPHPRPDATYTHDAALNAVIVRLTRREDTPTPTGDDDPGPVAA
jgi:hypothetical protein